MSERKLLRYSLIVSSYLPDPAVFTKNIYLPWTPDELKVRQIGFQFSTAAPAVGLFSLQCDTLTNQPGASLGIFFFFFFFFF